MFTDTMFITNIEPNGKVIRLALLVVCIIIEDIDKHIYVLGVMLLVIALFIHTVASMAQTSFTYLCTIP